MEKLVTRFIGSFINLTAWILPRWSTNYSFKLLCKVRRVGISEKGKLFLDEAETSYLTVDDGKQQVALHKWGTGDKTLLFLHGWMSNSQRWRPYVSQLDPNVFTIYALDAPGHGMSVGTRLNLEIFRNSLSQTITTIGKVDVLVAHSFGCLATAYTKLWDKKLPVNKYVIMGSPSGMDAIFIYFEELLGLSKKAIANLDEKIADILKLPHSEITLENFFYGTKEAILVIHDESDKITPFHPIKEAVEINGSINTHFVTGQDHNLKGESTVKRVIDFIKE